ncbi:MAG: hypothetical protein CVV28_10100 [Methanobacteriales archaeon HGW-Methanobacteriales-1]|jgi:predicted RNase H-like HicB family nuclease|nr:MAG: hypothetical protein CVV28_10100 [Methanobacteriales archaeon HGW-Methanobacteriales-1]
MADNQKMNVPVFITKEENSFVVFCPSFHVLNQGSTAKVAIYNLKEGFEPYFLEENLKKVYNFINFN